MHAAANGINGASRHDAPPRAAVVPLPTDPRRTFLHQLDWIRAEATREGSSLKELETRVLEAFHPAEDMPPDDLEELLDRFPHLEEIVIDGIARRNEVATLISASKIGKTWMALALALMAAMGWDFLGHRVPRRIKVLVIDTELRQATLVSRLRTLMEALGISREALGGRVKARAMRGTGFDVSRLEKLVNEYARFEPVLIIIDSLYRLLPTGTDENSNGGMKDVIEKIVAFAARMNAAVVVVHHSSKGSQADKDVVDVGSGAGSIARITDNHMILRQHAEDNHAVFETRPRSFAPSSPMVLRFDFPLWHIADGMDPTLLRNSTKGKQAEKDTAARTELMQAVGRVLEKGQKATMTAIRNATKTDADAPQWRLDRVKRILALAVSTGQLQENTDADGTYFTMPIVPPEEF